MLLYYVVTTTVAPVTPLIILTLTLLPNAEWTGRHSWKYKYNAFACTLYSNRGTYSLTSKSAYTPKLRSTLFLFLQRTIDDGYIFKVLGYYFRFLLQLYYYLYILSLIFPQIQIFPQKYPLRCIFSLPPYGLFVAAYNTFMHRTQTSKCIGCTVN